VPVRFVVEQAGCASCAELIRDVLGELGVVEEVEVDEQADTATVRLEPRRPLEASELERVLGEASIGSGHTYSVRVGSLVGID
jgi:hypothetical protein